MWMRKRTNLKDNLKNQSKDTLLSCHNKEDNFYSHKMTENQDQKADIKCKQKGQLKKSAILRKKSKYKMKYNLN